MSDAAIVAHQFEDAAQQREAVSLGMWIFLATEILLFGGLFLGYTIYRMSYPQMFREMSHHMNLLLGTINTIVLLTSSLTMVLAVHTTRHGLRRQTILYLLATAALGGIFLAIKAVEYHEEYTHHLIPLPGWEFQSAPHLTADGRMFMNFYFVMTGLHAIHLIIAIALMLWLTLLACRTPVLATRESTVEVAGLYWHLVDVVWVFLFPLLYLLGR